MAKINFPAFLSALSLSQFYSQHSSQSCPCKIKSLLCTNPLVTSIGFSSLSKSNENLYLRYTLIALRPPLLPLPPILNLSHTGHLTVLVQTQRSCLGPLHLLFLSVRVVFHLLQIFAQLSMYFILIVTFPGHSF